MSRHRVVLLLAIGLCSQTAEAQDSWRTEVLRFQHPAASGIRGFKVYWGTEPGVYAFEQDLGMPAAGPEGVYRASIRVPRNQTIYLALAAVATNGLESQVSGATIRPPRERGD